MDGVITTTARMHASAWKRTFDDFLTAWDAKHGSSTELFSIVEDYPTSVDGKPRQDGVRDFLASRDLTLPEGDEESLPGEWSISGIGKRKQEHVEEALRTEGVEVFPGSVAWLRELREKGLRTAVVTSSMNCERILTVAGILDLFDTRVDGHTAVELGLAGKPAPDVFLEAADRLGVEPARAVVVEDSQAGVEAGRAGAFGLVIGVDRSDRADVLYAAGADLVVEDLSVLVTAETDHFYHRPAGPRSHRLRAAATRLIAAEGDFPVDEHCLVERGFDAARVPQMESIFALSNGYMGLRGVHDEGRPSYDPAVLLNGFYETWPIEYPEPAAGFAEIGQTIVSVPDGTPIRIYVGDEPFVLGRSEVLEYERVLDMGAGVLTRRILWRSSGGDRFEITTRRLVSFVSRHLACIEYEVTSLDEDADLTISSDLLLHPENGDRVREDPRRGRALGKSALEKIAESADDQQVIVAYRTKNSELKMACGMDHRLTAGVLMDEPQIITEDDWSRVVYRFNAAQGQAVRLVKFLAYHHDGDGPVAELTFRVKMSLQQAAGQSFEGTLARQRDYVKSFWERSDVVVEGAPLLQQAIHFNLFQLLQASARAEGYGIPAKGLTGRGYDGHYFWDTEIYAMPFFTYTAPHIAKNLLRHRYRMLDKARQRAREVNEHGALFPWRTIGGDEASAYYVAGTAQYHINADIAYALVQHVQATGDTDFLARYGAEILVETARLWAGLGFFSERKGGHFVINGVTGPDEYSALVDNNTYTNLMAQENMRQAVRAVEHLHKTDLEAHARLLRATGLDDGELEVWRRAADLMYVPYDEERRLHLQDDGVLDLERWDFENTPLDHYPLLLHYHPLVLYRHQVIKQADVVLATFLLSELFTFQEKRNILEYYDPLTTSDSSLSECIQSIMAAEVGDDLRAAEEYFIDAVGIDLADMAGNVRDGVHVASAGGVWMALVNGFGGMRDRNGQLSFRPRLPRRMTRLAFKIQMGEKTLRVEVDEEATSYQLLAGDELTILHDGRPVTVRAGEEVRQSLLP
ncbi:MAG: beta-phosphoglucomutase family hydrolase [Actinobacteria bacterium]|jgi:alpha,alpha-trehalose phosphorylase|nr:beta-phosphoglucomutase family hydrolase [Actinomycetota bacterium]